MKKILCMGSINMDLVMFADTIPVPGQTLMTDNFQTFPGGKGGNQAVAVAEMGGDVRFFTKLGDDVFSKQLTEEMKNRGVQMDSILTEKNGTAGVAMIMVDREGQNSILFNPGANAHLSPDDVVQNASLFDDCEILLVTMEINPETAYEAIRIAKSKGMTVVLDPAPVPKQPIPKEIACLVDYVKPNETEAQTITGFAVSNVDNGKLALQALQEYGFKNPILSLGKQGVLTTDNGIVLHEPVVDLKPLDTTAAGDVFLGGFVASLSRGMSCLECIRFAQTAAAISVTRKGAQTSIPSFSEVQELYLTHYR